MASPPVQSLTVEERRAKRQARREEQRRQNIGRAQKMHAARLDFEKSTAKKLPFTNKVKGLQTFIGCSGWFYWHWRGSFYSDALATKDWFTTYARHFKTVELNAPFYSWPTVNTVKTWLRQMGKKDFYHTVKANELLTHTKKFKGTKELVKDFGLIADLLDKKMGCFLFQFPPSFHYTLTRLKSIVGQLDPARRNVVEFRHKSWWNNAVYIAFRKHGIIFCSCSGPRLPDELIKTTDDLYIRFYGTKKWYQYDYTKEELAVWAARIKKSKAKRAWIYFNNDRNAYAIKNAKELRKQLRKGK